MRGDNGPEAPLRRAPFADNPAVGHRGTQTYQRIVGAALEVFRKSGYDGCRVEQITETAGCSRPSFYQYFSSKEDVFRQIAGQVARSLQESAEELQPVGPDEEGWAELRRWVGRYGAIYEEFEPVFATFGSAAASDSAVASGARRVQRKHAATVARKLLVNGTEDGAVTDLVAVVLNMLARANRFRSVLAASSRTFALPRRRVEDAITDVIHRAAHGPVPGVNIRETVISDRTLRLRSSDAITPRSAAPHKPELGAAGRRMRSTLIDAGAETFVRLGYHATRVDDITEAAGVSHGTFYRYFQNKDHVFRVIAARAGNRVLEAFDRLTDISDDEARDFDSWLRDFVEAYHREAAIIRVWTEAMAGDPELNAMSARSIDHLRRRAALFLLPRQFGDIDADALVFLALLDGESDLAPIGRKSADRLSLVSGVISQGLLATPAGSRSGVGSAARADRRPVRQRR